MITIGEDTRAVNGKARVRDINVEERARFTGLALRLGRPLRAGMDGRTCN